MKKILILSTYPIKNPIHGGQKRVAALYNSYRKAGFEVDIKSIFFPLHYREYCKDDVKIPKKYLVKMSQSPLTGDVITGEIIRDDLKLKEKIKKKIKESNPDIIQLEHPFLYIGLEDIIMSLQKKPKLVFSSHNTEYKMKEEMLKKEGYPAIEIKNVVGKIHSIEKRLANDADLIISVSENDKKDLIGMGISKNKIIVARNGMEIPKPSKAALKFWDDFFKEKGVTKTAVFIGSAHPPNWNGFLELINNRIGFLKPNQRIVLAGGISEYFKNYYTTNNPESVIFWKRVLPVGKLTQDKLSALIMTSSCILLPITEGGGSNLKTAEALLSGKQVVCTSYALRSFEEFSNNPKLKIADTQDSFIKEISTIMSTDTTEPKEVRSSELLTLTWQEILKDVTKEVSEL
jgi:hypothetical protein